MNHCKKYSGERIMTKYSNIVKVLIDSREPAKIKNKAAIFFKKKGIPTDIHTNKDGDLVFILKNKEKVLIERKTYPDFVSSYIKNDHIQDQAIRLSEYNYYACIVHGSIFDLRRVKALSRINQDSVNKMVANLMLFYKLPIFFTDDDTQYFKLSLLIAETVGKHHGQALESMKLTNGLQDRPDISILMAQKDIGIKKAEMLLDKFGSPAGVLNAPRDELREIKGVGDAMVASIQELKNVFNNGVKK